MAGSVRRWVESEVERAIDDVAGRLWWGCALYGLFGGVDSRLGVEGLTRSRLAVEESRYCRQTRLRGEVASTGLIYG